LGKASSEIFAQFFIRIYREIPSSILAAFSKLKILQSPNFIHFRNTFRSRLIKLFFVPAFTFDNVKERFPIGFFIWDTNEIKSFKSIKADVYDKDGLYLFKKKIISYDKCKYISDWLEDYSKNISSNYIGHLASVGNDFQHQRDVYIDDVNRKKIAGGRHTMIAIDNLFVVSIFFTVRNIISADWVNDRDQFLFPNDGWKMDTEFQNDCLAYTLFNTNIQSKYGVNHWIPYSEADVNAKDNFESHFMLSFIKGKIIQNGYSDLFEQQEDTFCIKRKFSDEAKAVFKAGKKLWKYYHSQPSANVNASLYDIREFFQGRDDSGKMNNKSGDDTYNVLIKELRQALSVLSDKIKPKVYEYGFLME
jgi:hypothetical protein